MRRRLALLGALAALFILCGIAGGQSNQPHPKRLLVIGATAAFRHPSIPNWEIYLHQIAPDFDGQVAMTFMSDAPNYPFPKVPQRSAGGGGPGRGGFPGMAPNTSDDQQAAITAASIPLSQLNTAVTTAQTAVTTAAYTGSAGDVRARIDALAEAEKTLALARADAVAKIQASPNKLSAEQLQGLAGVMPPGGRGGGNPMGGGADPQVLAALFKQYMSPEALKNYDGIFFVSSTGVLPIPDEAAFLEWVKQGHGVIGIHAAMDRGETSDAQMEMLSAGARFNGHPGNANAPSKVVRVDPNFPATKDFPSSIDIADEFYSYHWHDLSGKSGVDSNTWIPGVDYSKVHALLELDRGDGVAFPVAWAKMYGTGRVFYSSLGHRDDVFMAGPSMDYDGLRDNGDAVNAAERKHIVNGIKWALGLVDGDVTPGNLKVDPKQQVARSAATGGGRGGQ